MDRNCRKIEFPDIEQTGVGILRKLGSGTPKQTQNTIVSSNAVASHIVVTSRAPKDKQHTVEVKRELKTLKAQATETEHSRLYTCEEVSNVLKDVKPGKDLNSS